MSAAFTKTAAITLAFITYFIAHGAVRGHPPIERQNTNSKKLTIEKFFESSLKRCTKFGQAHSNNERKNTFIDFAFYMVFPDLIWVTSSAEKNFLWPEKEK